MNSFARRVSALLTTYALVLLALGLPTQTLAHSQHGGAEAFTQLDSQWRAPNRYRNASGAPTPDYWQQRADYDIKVRLDERERRLLGDERITYTNNSPDTLPFLWIQLEQNRYRTDSFAHRTETVAEGDDGEPAFSTSDLRREQALRDGGYGYEISSITDGSGRDLNYRIIGTNLRLELPTALAPGGRFDFRIRWAHNLLHEEAIGSRSGYEHFPESDTYTYFAAQWFPRMAAYTDYAGWHVEQFLGRGEFTLEFGDYSVEITVPADHVVAATGELKNANAVLSGEQRSRLRQARSADRPVMIVTPEEALAAEQAKSALDSGATRTWRFEADNVRDFAWASSRKFIWDAMGYRQAGGGADLVMAMSYYPQEAEPTWSAYSTEAVVHTMEVYSRFSFPYPWPTAISVNTWERGGMEYPMITFNGYRPEIHDWPDGEDAEAQEKPERTWSRRQKQGLIGVIIHEIGHMYFPMIVNSDERTWTWMDEGLNSFLQYLAELEWEENFHYGRGDLNPLRRITEYMTSEGQVPVMTQSDSVLQFGPNAYSKPAAALVVLRETVMGRDVFDAAFREYARRWMFRRPTPEDFFRTMEDASGLDLDWFWRGWFYTTGHVDVALTRVREYQISTEDPDVEMPLARERYAEEFPEPLAQQRNRDAGLGTRLQRRPFLSDFYNDHDPWTVSNADRNKYRGMLEGMEDWEREALARATDEGAYFYVVEFENRGGVLTPLPLELVYADDSREALMVPAEIWRRNSERVRYTFRRPKQIASVIYDPAHQTADATLHDNQFPQRIRTERISATPREDTERDLMADMLEDLEEDEAEAQEGEGTQ